MRFHRLRWGNVRLSLWWKPGRALRILLCSAEGFLGLCQLYNNSDLVCYKAPLKCTGPKFQLLNQACHQYHNPTSFITTLRRTTSLRSSVLQVWSPNAALGHHPQPESLLTAPSCCHSCITQPAARGLLPVNYKFRATEGWNHSQTQIKLGKEGTGYKSAKEKPSDSDSLFKQVFGIFSSWIYMRKNRG